jgi:hypothetical protein
MADLAQLFAVLGDDEIQHCAPAVASAQATASTVCFGGMAVERIWPLAPAAAPREHRSKAIEFYPANAAFAISFACNAPVKSFILSDNTI